MRSGEERDQQTLAIAAAVCWGVVTALLGGLLLAASRWSGLVDDGAGVLEVLLIVACAVVVLRLARRRP